MGESRRSSSAFKHAGWGGSLTTQQNDFKDHEAPWSTDDQYECHTKTDRGISLHDRTLRGNINPKCLQAKTENNEHQWQPAAVICPASKRQAENAPPSYDGAAEKNLLWPSLPASTYWTLESACPWNNGKSESGSSIHDRGVLSHKLRVHDDTLGIDQLDEPLNIFSDAAPLIFESGVGPASTEVLNLSSDRGIGKEGQASIHTSSEALPSTPCATGACFIACQRCASPKPQIRRTVPGDRFSSPGKLRKTSRTTFLVSTPPSRLSTSQRLRRRRTGTSDPFASCRHRASQLDDRTFNNTSFQLLRSSSIRAERVSDTRVQPQSNTIYHFAARPVGGATTSALPMDEGHGGFTSPRANVRTYVSDFFKKQAPHQNTEMYQKRLALSLGIDEVARVLPIIQSPAYSCVILMGKSEIPRRYLDKLTGNEWNVHPTWKDNKWMKEGHTPFLEAPGLRDDFYCTVLAYSHAADKMAVALGSKIYLWSNATGVLFPPNQLEASLPRTTYITSLSFSSEVGKRSILAIGGGDGGVVLWSPLDDADDARFFRFTLPTAVTHLSFRPCPVARTSQRHSTITTKHEVLLVGDDQGVIFIYFVEWPDDNERFLFGWHGSIRFHAQIIVHSQQICGVTWSQNGNFFATGGNDNVCCLLQTSGILSKSGPSSSSPIEEPFVSNHGTEFDFSPNYIDSQIFGPDHAKQRWKLQAAVKAMAFCPWQNGLLAARGGSNDRSIHFFHTVSGARLATIDCAAQITSLTWSNTRREIAATFGFAQPEHPFRIAVYSWPDCRQVVAIPWHTEMRALHAITYPGGPERPQQRQSRQRHIGAWEEECLVVAASDGSIKFHEIWSGFKTGTAAHPGVLCGSDILEGLHGIEKESKETIR